VVASRKGTFTSGERDVGTLYRGSVLRPLQSQELSTTSTFQRSGVVVVVVVVIVVVVTTTQNNNIISIFLVVQTGTVAHPAGSSRGGKAVGA
jgi:hypothetical protein